MKASKFACDMRNLTHGVYVQFQVGVSKCVAKSSFTRLLILPVCRPLEVALECRIVERDAATAELQAAAVISVTRQAQVPFHTYFVHSVSGLLLHIWNPCSQCMCSQDRGSHYDI